MKKTAGILLVLILIPCLLPAQNDRPDNRIAIMETAVSAADLESISVSILITEQPEADLLEISPFDDESGVIMITGRPYSEFEFKIPSEMALVNQHGEEAKLLDLQMMRGPERSSDLMEVVTPSLCAEAVIPESGHLYIRVGGTVASDKTLRGTFSGSLNIDCGADRDE